MFRLFLTATFLLVGAVSAPVYALLIDHDCSFCHNLHGAPGPTLLNDASVEVLCMSCHATDNGDAAAVEVHTNDNNSAYPAFRISCLGCHDPHDNQGNWLAGTNIKTIGSKLDASRFARIETPSRGIQDVVFEARTGTHSFADNDDDGNGIRDGVCEICHTQTKHHRWDQNSNHQSGADCTRCHAHATSFNRN